MSLAEEMAHGSPLLEIQCYEAEVGSMVEAANETAVKRLKQVRKQAAELQQRAADLGQADGKAEYEKILSEARTEAKPILVQAHGQAAGLRRNRAQCVEAMVQYVLETIADVEKGVSFA